MAGELKGSAVPSKCKKCGAEIVFIKTPAGKFMPCDAKETRIVTKEGGTIGGYAPHWGSCPFSKYFKKGSGKNVN